MTQRGNGTSLGGRRSSIAEAKALLALWASLSTEGASVDASVISRRLGVDENTAQRLLDLLVSARGGESDYLPLYMEDDGSSKSLALLPMGAEGSPGLKLTDGESAALVAALDALGISNDDPLREKLSKLSVKNGKGAQAATIQKRLTAAYSSTCGSVLLVCSQALANGDDLDFAYQGTADTKSHERHVSPTRIRHGELLWYLDGYDYDRSAERTFRADRMSRPRLVVHRQGPAPNHTEPDSVRMVRLTFHDQRCLSALDWPGLDVLQESDGITIAQIPYYESSSTWLVRRLASTAGRVTTNDTVLRSSVQSYARRLLDEDSNEGQ